MAVIWLDLDGLGCGQSRVSRDEPHLSRKECESRVSRGGFRWSLYPTGTMSSRTTDILILVLINW